MSANISPEAKAFLSELAAEIATNGNPDGDLIDEAQAAFARRQAFAHEMRCKTPRAQMAAKALALAIWTRVQNEKNVARLMFDCAEVTA